MEENLSDAILMAGAMIVFIIALTFSMSSFRVVTKTIDEILQYDSKIDLVTDENHNYLNYETAGNDESKSRTVGIETIISSIYRISKENYIVYINTDVNLDSTGMTKKSNFNNQYKNSTYIPSSNNTYEITINGKNSNIQGFDKGLYQNLKDKKFKEYLGIYQENTSANEANRTTYRVITYVQTT